MKRLAFTLVELLVVIGIIALLVAMLLPSLQKARTQAKKVSCLSNMRQTILALQMYGVQFNDYPWNVMPGFDISVYNISNDPGKIYKTPAEIVANATTSVVPTTYRDRWYIDGACQAPWWLYYLRQGHFMQNYKAAACSFEVPDGWEIQYMRTLQTGLSYATSPVDQFVPVTADELRKYPTFTYTGPAVVDDFWMTVNTGGQVAFDWANGPGLRSGAHFPHLRSKGRNFILYCSVWSNPGFPPYTGGDNYLAPHERRSLRNRLILPMSGALGKQGHSLSQTIGWTDGSATLVEQPSGTTDGWWVNYRGDVTRSTTSFQPTN